MNKRSLRVMYCLVCLIAWLMICNQDAVAISNIVNTKHNLSASGPGEIKALTESRICIFCHTPHNSTPQTPLWNREIKPTNYVTYSSSTMVANIPQPTGPTRLCLSCHDGTIALGMVLSEEQPIETTMEITSLRSSFIGTDISNDHPVSFSYDSSLPNSELNPFFPSDLMQYDQNYIHCTTCHDAHDDTYGNFLAKDNTYSALCTRCHIMSGWSLSSHRTSTATWDNTGIDPWPHSPWLTVAENACGNCHVPHNAAGAKRLLNYLREEDNCYVCHSGTVAESDILSEEQKISNHPMMMATIGISPNAHDPKEDPVMDGSHVECVDCHNPHASFASGSSTAPIVSGRMALVSGVAYTGNTKESVDYEYEVCFKCHGDLTNIQPFINRVIDQNNTRLEFDPINPSFHPVVAPGKNFDVPSIPSVYEPSLTVSTYIYCKDCHDSNDSAAIGGTGAVGPHGSIYRPILREKYTTIDNSVETFANYALCYRCHDRDSILSDITFQKNSLSGSNAGGHSGHLQGHGTGINRATCSVCHDPHGIYDDGLSGSHTHLINFDTSIVSPAAGQTVPYFIDKGSRSGSCNLVCHGFTHTDANSSYP